MKRFVVSFTAGLGLLVGAQADIILDGANSFYGGGNALVPDSGMWRAGSGDTAAWIGGGMDGSIYNTGFQSTPPGDPSGRELTNTVLTAGTPVTLAFTKNQGDHINYIAMNADPFSPVSFVKVDKTHFTISFSIVNPVASASSDLGAAQGLGINITADPRYDYKGSIFLTDLAPGDVRDPVNPVSGAIVITADGSDGVTGTFAMYASTNWMDAVGMTTPDLAGGYFGDTNGNSLSLPPGFSMSKDGYYNMTAGTSDPGGNAYKFVLQNSAWSAHNLGVITLPEPSTGLLLTLGLAGLAARPHGKRAD